MSIGIPAHNEEKNIHRLITAIQSQKQISFSIDKIIVITSGDPNDQTPAILRTCKEKDPRITIVEDPRRTSQTDKQNRIIHMTTSDTLLLINADVIPENDMCLEEMVTAYQQNPSCGLVRLHVTPEKIQNRVQRILQVGFYIKDAMIQNWNSGDNTLASHGACGLFSRELYSHITWPEAIGEDAYAYVMCKRLSLPFVYLPQTHILTQLPSTLNDHIKQSARFFNNENQLSQYITKEEMGLLYIPKSLFAYHAFCVAIRHPFRFFLYFCLVIYSKIESRRPQYRNVLWSQSNTTK